MAKICESQGGERISVLKARDSLMLLEGGRGGGEKAKLGQKKKRRGRGDRNRTRAGKS